MNDSTDYHKYTFTVVDYCVFIIMVLLSTGTGIYFSFRKRPKPDAEATTAEADKKRVYFGSTKMSEYLLGSRQLQVFPVAMSLIGSYVSGVTVLGTPSEIYNFGTQYWLVVIAICLSSFTVAKVYLPVFSILRVGSSYEYLEVRFSSVIRSYISLLFLLDEVFFLPMIVFIPAIAFSQVTGINLHIVGAAVCIICVFYTFVGGIKAVVHTDAWQILVMFLSVATVAVVGTIGMGGPGEVFKRAKEGGRLIFFETSPSLYKRQTIWSTLIGGFIYWTSFNSVNQTMVQRYMSLPTLKKGQISILIFTIGMVAFASLSCYCGLLVYGFYKTCDPLTAGYIEKDDQLFPMYVMQAIGHLTGVPGLFIAGVFGAALSSLSVVLNSTALVFLEDVVKGCLKLKPAELSTTIIVKGCIIFLGFIAFSLIFVLERLSSILSVATILTAIAASTSYGVFTLGMLIPWSNSKGALIGAMSGSLITLSIAIGINAMEVARRILPHKLDISVADCPVNVTIQEVDFSPEEDVFPLFRIAFFWSTPIGAITTILVGTIVSFLTGPTDLQKLNADLISPVIHQYLPDECFVDSETARKPAPDKAAHAN